MSVNFYRLRDLASDTELGVLNPDFTLRSTTDEFKAVWKGKPARLPYRRVASFDGKIGMERINVAHDEPGYYEALSDWLMSQGIVMDTE